MTEVRLVMRLGRYAGVLAGVLVMAGCGGRSVSEEQRAEDEPEAELTPNEPDSSPAPTATSTPSSPPTAPSAPPTPSAPVPPPPDTPVPPPPDTSAPPPPDAPVPPSTPVEPTCEELSLVAEAEWFAQAPGYGLVGPGMLSFSPNGERLATTGGQYAPQVVVFDVATGAGTYQALDHETVFGRDAGFRLELRGTERSLRAINLETGGDAFRADLSDGVLGAAISADARYVGALGCRAGTLVASRFALEGGELREVMLESCELYVSDVVFTLVENGRAALVSANTAGSVTRVDFDDASVSAASLHALTFTSQSVLAVALSPDSSLGVSTGTDTIVAWSYPDLEPRFEPVPYTPEPSFTGCYTEGRYLSALAFSADGRFVTTPAEGGRLTLRRTCDFAPVFEVERGLSPACSRGDTPAGLAAFSPAGDRLAVWWGGAVGIYRLAPSVAAR